jgi:hypothetical protein
LIDAHGINPQNLIRCLWRCLKSLYLLGIRPTAVLFYQPIFHRRCLSGHTGWLFHMRHRAHCILPYLRPQADGSAPFRLFLLHLIALPGFIRFYKKTTESHPGL